jgi:hypothetical protein
MRVSDPIQHRLGGRGGETALPAELKCLFCHLPSYTKEID